MDEREGRISREKDHSEASIDLSWNHIRRKGAHAVAKGVMVRMIGDVGIYR